MMFLCFLNDVSMLNNMVLTHLGSFLEWFLNCQKCYTQKCEYYFLMEAICV